MLFFVYILFLIPHYNLDSNRMTVVTMSTTELSNGQSGNHGPGNGEPGNNESSNRQSGNLELSNSQPGHHEPSNGEPDNEGEDVVCKRATPEQMTLHFENNSQMHAAPLARSQYIQIKSNLLTYKANVGTTQHWVLFKPSDPKTIISSCSIYFRDAIINTGRGMESTNIAIITDIFTHLDFRRRGMATKLLTKVQQVLDNMEQKHAALSIIYSGANNGLYNTLGWKPHRASHQRIRVGLEQIAKPQRDDTTRILTPKDIYTLSRESVNMAKLRLSSLPHYKAMLAQVLPTDLVVGRHLCRSRALECLLNSPKARVHTRISGVLCFGDTDKRDAYAWA